MARQTETETYDPGRKVSFHCNPELRAELTARDPRANRSLIAKRDMTRYYKLLARELATVNLDPDDLVKIAKALHRRTLDADDADLLWGAVHEVDQVLARRLRDLTPAQAMAVVDAAERYELRRAGGEGKIAAASDALAEAEG